MPNAIRIDDMDRGIFFHKVPEAYKGNLGDDISGGCVRLNAATAKFLYAQMEKYGAIEVIVTQPRQYAEGDGRHYCDQRKINEAIEANSRARDSGAIAKNTGTEGVVGGIQHWDPVAQFADPFNQKGTGGWFGLGHIFNPQPAHKTR
jgi:hypothetical protein